MDAWGLTPNRRNLATLLILLQLVSALNGHELRFPKSAFGQSPEDAQSLLEFLALPSNTEYELVAPFEVDHEGRYISHAVAHHQRYRRSLDRGESASISEPVHLRLSGLSQNFHLELRLSSGLIAPGFKIQRLRRNGTASLQEYSPHDLCFYQGILRSKVNSSVALSTCGGMSGLIRTQEADYLIRPVHPHLAVRANFSTPPGHQPHILYKRSADHQHKPHTPRHHRRHDGGLDPGHRDDKPAQGQKQHFCGSLSTFTIALFCYCVPNMPCTPTDMPKPPPDDIPILPDEYPLVPRGKRAVALHGTPSGQKLNVEALVVVDKRMMDNHGHENVTTYVLTVLNMVSTLFKDGTIGGDINIVIVGLILLEEEQDGLSISHHADHTLNSFCQWQAGLSGREGQRHDHAILLTGLDICSWKNEPCDTLGFAPISGMCSKYRSCTINEDTGLGLAFTIAHESGHNFGMVHDGEGNVCKKSVGNIMSPTLAGHNGVFSWSSCSRQYLSRFLSTAQATCLSDEPQATGEYEYPQQLPGELYDTDTQCKWQFGEKAKLCTLNFKKDICKALWCHRVGRKCETKFLPAAEGSVCGPDMWCRRGHCVKQGDSGPVAVHGQWSSWSGWSSCSRTCESGVTYRERHCNNPKPMYGGRFCEGPSRSHKLCNTKDCPPGNTAFRAVQCAEFNSKPFRGWYFKWSPYTHVDDQDACKLYCLAEGYDFFFALSSKVKDGTPCAPGSPNVCIDGVCERVGCDRVLGSWAKPDVCGVCRGNNSTCKVYRGQYNKQHRSNQYYSVVTIPAGARSIRLLELNASSSYLAIRSVQKKYHLNGRWTIDWPGRHNIAGTVFDYSRPYNRPESLTASGPTNETLVVEILLQGRNPGIQWEYSLNQSHVEQRTPPKHNYTWAIVRSTCSATCAGGTMTTKIACYRDLRVQVNTSFCNPRSRPSSGTVQCNTQPCPPSWSVGSWGLCSRTCGEADQSREVECVQRTAPGQVEKIPNSRCPQPTPPSIQSCHNPTCPPQWSTGPWSQCSSVLRCGKGARRRLVECRSVGTGARALPDRSCDARLRPSSQESCQLRRCSRPAKGQWVLSTWQQCSVTCGVGVQKRLLKCAEKDAEGKYQELAAKRCQHAAQPSVGLQRACVQPECPRPAETSPSWYTSPWSQCTVSCGGGVQSRTVQCLLSGRPVSGCPGHIKPPMAQACNAHYCPRPSKKEMECKDHFNWCYLVPQHGVCHHKYYGHQCCQSCSHPNL
ncbi:A disintegrin and metalloproteinase with thrombospondin motifs 16 [Clupea harengus]|uniref:A disintegrin and metalloproteinase with thrombospondin motifs 16 n=1 Tax=Clupea harengus TaxID=7950 RepID=A0A8M1KU57_CLUHA|nr:A disintegrin and metalloproteinase with thrombospondin motifs 16 [Clupea harengus]